MKKRIFVFLSVLLLAACDPATVVITFDSNGGSGEMPPQTVEVGVGTKLADVKFVKEGFVFTGWNDKADGTGKFYENGATVTPMADLTLYARWQEIPNEDDPSVENDPPAWSDAMVLSVDNSSLIAGETASVSVTGVSDVTMTGAVYRVQGSEAKTLTLGADGLSFTAPDVADVTTASVTATFLKAGEEETASRTLEGEFVFYPNTYVRFNDQIFAPVKAFDFKDDTTLTDVKYLKGNEGTDAGEISPGGDGFVITVNEGEKYKLEFPRDTFQTAELILVNLKFDKPQNANVYIAQGTVDAVDSTVDYGYSLYKDIRDYYQCIKYGSFLLGTPGGNAFAWNPAKGSSFEFEATSNVFNTFAMFDNGDDLPVLGFNDRVWPVETDVAGWTSKLTDINPFQITFEENGEDATVKYTINAVKFYKPVN